MPALLTFRWAPGKLSGVYAGVHEKELPPFSLRAYDDDDDGDASAICEITLNNLAVCGSVHCKVLNRSRCIFKDRFTRRHSEDTNLDNKTGLKH